SWTSRLVVWILSLVPGERPISSLILAELYESGDAGFVERLIEHRGSFKPLLGAIERWKKDARPWARQMKLIFVLDERLTTDHRVVIKRVLKQAWHDRDHELMGAMMLRMDRSIRRQRRKQYRYVNR